MIKCCYNLYKVIEKVYIMAVKKTFWVLVFSIISLVILGGIVNTYAELPRNLDELKTLKIRQSTNPSICIFEVNPSISDNWYDIKNSTLIALYSWQEKLSEKYTMGDWIIRHVIIPWEEHEDKSLYDYPQCNVMINYEDKNSINSVALGTTSINFKKSSHKFMLINIYLIQPKQIIDVNIGDISDNKFTINTKKIDVEINANAVKNIVLHEFGHAIGIYHYNIVIPLGVSENNVDRSVMIPTIDPFNENQVLNITNSDMEVVEKLYGSDGWEGVSPPYIVNKCTIFNLMVVKCY